MRTSLRWGTGPISPQNGKSNTQTGQLDPHTLLRKRYLIVRAIGRGGMAAVYEARDTRNGTSCAIKEMSLSNVPAQERSQAIQNFLAEARILSRLKHSNLPAFTDFFTEGTRYFLVMEFIDGSTLEELLEANNGPFSERRVLGWARQLCDVLEYLHNQQPPVIFRDLKPGNIMLTRNGRIKLIDFGIARLFRSSGAQDTQLLGTPGFAPPEQYGSAQTDERSDIYSLAMTLSQLMTDAVNDTGFGLKDLHFTYPHISPPVARVLEKATALKPDDRYESIMVFRRALLGIGTFRFENGGEATTPDELSELCSHYREEAADYLFAGEVESWLQEIGKDEMARAAKRLRVTVGDPDMAVDRLIQMLLGNEPRSRSGVSGSGQNGTTQRGAESSSRAGRVREPALLVEPKSINFGEVYPGLSAPILLTLSAPRGLLVSGSLRVVENWIVLDQTTFDGTKIPINVRVDSTRLRGSTHYTGTIMITPDEGEREISVTVEADVMGFTTTSLARKQANQASMAGLDDDDDVVVPGTGRVRMAPQATVTVDQPLDTSQTTEYTTKYGLPGSGGWDPLHGVSTRQSGRMKEVLTFIAAFMTSGFYYFTFAHLPLFLKNPPLPPNPWFSAVLIGLVPMATLGVGLVNWLSSWRVRETVNAACTSLTLALLALGLCEAGWQNLLGAGAPVLHLLSVLLVTSLAATVGAWSRVSNTIINAVLWGMRRVRLLMIGLTVLLTGSLGITLTSTLGLNWFTPFGLMLGIGVGVLLILRADHLLKQKPHP